MISVACIVILIWGIGATMEALEWHADDSCQDESTVRARHRNTGGRNTATTTELGCRRIATNDLLKYPYRKYIEAMKGHQKKVTMLL